MLNPSAVSPKRSAMGGPFGGGAGGAPKLGFLAQLTARAAKKSSGTEGDSENSNNNSIGENYSSVAVDNKPVSSKNPFAGAARSLFSEIAKFRKPDAEEVVAESQGIASGSDVVEDKENASSSINNANNGKIVYCFS